MTFAEYILTSRGYERKYFLDFAKHRMTAYQIYCSIPSKLPKKPIHKWISLPTDENVDLGLSVEEMRRIWNELK